MSNILPTVSKKAMWRAYRLRFVTAGSFVVLVCAAIAALALSPSFLALRMVDMQPQGSAPTSGSFAADRSTVARTQGLVSVLAPLMATSTPSSAILAVLSLRPHGISITGLSLTRGSPGTLVLTGVSSGNTVLDAYQRTLRTSGTFSSVSVPVNDLVGTGGGRFTMTLTGQL